MELHNVHFVTAFYTMSFKNRPLLQKPRATELLLGVNIFFERKFSAPRIQKACIGSALGLFGVAELQHTQVPGRPSGTGPLSSIHLETVRLENT